jgi:small subunit ribosomal protein S19
MSRSLRKPYYVNASFLRALQKTKKAEGSASKKPIKVFDRSTTIIPETVGMTFLVYNGKKFISIFVTDRMLGFKFGSFAPTRIMPKHTSADKNLKKAK